MEIHGNLNMKGNELREAGLGIDTGFPLTPKPGRLTFTGGVAYVCAEIDEGMPVWIPITNQRQMKNWTQGVEALEWTIEHGLGQNTVFVQVYGLDGNMIVPESINTTEVDRVTIRFSIPVAGRALVMRGEETGNTPPPVSYEQGFVEQQVWVVNHQLGYNPIIRVIVGNQEVQPTSIVHDSTMQATVTFNSPRSGTVRCV